MTAAGAITTICDDVTPGSTVIGCPSSVTTGASGNPMPLIVSIPLTGSTVTFRISSRAGWSCAATNPVPARAQTSTETARTKSLYRMGLSFGGRTRVPNVRCVSPVDEGGTDAAEPHCAVEGPKGHVVLPSGTPPQARRLRGGKGNARMLPQPGGNGREIRNGAGDRASAASSSANERPTQKPRR